MKWKANSYFFYIQNLVHKENDLNFVDEEIVRKTLDVLKRAKEDESKSS